jgi:hypothetical protein
LQVQVVATNRSLGSVPVGVGSFLQEEAPMRTNKRTIEFTEVILLLMVNYNPQNACQSRCIKNQKGLVKVEVSFLGMGLTVRTGMLESPITLCCSLPVKTSAKPISCWFICIIRSAWASLA